jgi:hypothetical protein
MSCDDECAVEKTEAKEWAYFSGITTGRLGERKRILALLEAQRVGYGSVLINELIELLGVKR